MHKHLNDPSLLRATIRTVGWKPLLIGCLLILKVRNKSNIFEIQYFIFKKAAVIIQPILIICLMDFFEPCSTMSISYACLLTFSIVLMAICTSFFHHEVRYKEKAKFYN